MKKAIALLLALGMLLALGACAKPTTTPPASQGGEVNDANYPTPEKPMTIKLGHVGPPNSSLDQSAQYIANYINENTNGAIKMEVYPQGQLGDAIVMLDGLTSGTLECAMVGANEVATMIPDFYVFCLPFLFDSFEEFFTAVDDEEMIAKCNELTMAKGFRTLGFTSGIIRGFNNTKRAVRTPADSKGLSIRIMSGAIYVDIFEALGCTTSTMAFGEVYSALQQGVIDGEDNDADMMVTMKFMEVEKYHTELNCTVQSNPLFVGNECWEKLSPEQQKVFQDAANTWIDGYLDVFTATQKERLQTLADNGVDIVYLTADEKQAFIDATSAVYEKYSANINKELFDYVLERVKQYRGA